jgi:hypothetical protein
VGFQPATSLTPQPLSIASLLRNERAYEAMGRGADRLFL